MQVICQTDMTGRGFFKTVACLSVSSVCQEESFTFDVHWIFFKKFYTYCELYKKLDNWGYDIFFLLKFLSL